MKDANFLKSNGVNVEKSLELFGDMETYNETLKTFLEEVDEKLNNITRYKEIVKHKYQHYLDEKYAKLLLQKIELLEQELKNKVIYYQEPEEKEMEEHKRRR